MKMLVIGAGKMGNALAQDMADNPQVEHVTVADRDLDAARSLAARLPRGIGEAVGLDCDDEASVARLMKGQTVAVGAADYRYNEMLAKQALAARAHFCDLGGNNTVVNRELALNAAAREAGVTIIPDCGLAPGMVSVVVAHAIGRFDEVERVNIRVGGLPVHPQGPLRYQLVFSVRGLTNEYLEPAVVLRDHQLQTVPSLTEVEELEFPAPFGKLEAFQTSGGTSTLPVTYRDQVKDLDYKTIRYLGHCEKLRILQDLGLLSEEPLTVAGAQVQPRQLTEAALVKNLPGAGPDVVLVRVDVAGRSGGRATRRRWQFVEYGEERRGLSAMGRMTSFPASIIAQMMGDGTITQRGAVPQELAVPSARFMEELARRNIRVQESEF